ncbi:MAG: amidase [Gemmatimonadetes bacterium]|nr:amidase [Gemmatimonadota bacterium]
MAKGKWTAERLVQLYFGRMDAIDVAGPTLRAVLERNPDALAIARERDAERKAGKLRGPLHGIPVLIKGNIDTADRMQTTAGSYALAGKPAPKDAFLVERLRAAGAIILGKTNLSEWANFRSTHSSSGWSGMGGQTRNPYALDRSPSGSSSGSGSAGAANLAALTIGTETDGSITSPSSVNGLVGIKPTVGLVSRSGIVPISHSQDTAGPMCRTVRDAALLLSAITGVDARDGATAAQAGKVGDYMAALVPDALKGKRIGIPRKVYYGYHPAVDALAEQAISALKAAGAVIVDPADLPGAGKYGDEEFEVLLYEFKADMAAYLASRGASTTMRTMDDLIAFNAKDKARELAIFGQEIMELSAKKGPLTDAAYRKARNECVDRARTHGIDAIMARLKLDAFMAPTNGPAWLIDHVNGDAGNGGSSTQPAAVAGYPSITVPAGLVHGLPVGMQFWGKAWSEATLIGIAYGFEQATKARRAPTFAEHAMAP